LSESDGFAAAIADTRLALEVSVINRLAHRLTRLLASRDPLSEKVHLSAAGVLRCTVLGVLGGAAQRIGRRRGAASHTPRDA
jgi:hypothetical protein